LLLIKKKKKGGVDFFFLTRLISFMVEMRRVELLSVHTAP